MLEFTNVGTYPGGEGFLMQGAEKLVLFDAGYAAGAEKMVKKIEGMIAPRPLDYVVLTHSHYDHVSGSAYCRDRWPEVKVAAGEYAAYVFTREGARRTIHEMNVAAAEAYGATPLVRSRADISADIALKDGDTLDFGGAVFEVLNTPGHTKCTIALWCEKEKLLVANETIGVRFRNIDVTYPLILVGYDMAVESLKRVMALKPERILVPHLGIVEGKEADAYLKGSEKAMQRLEEMVVTGCLAGKTNNELLAEYRKRFYTPQMAAIQPEPAFMLNASYTIPLLVRQCAHIEDNNS